MKELVLIGGGGHCHSCIDVIESRGEYRIRGIVDSRLSRLDKVLAYPVLGDDDDLGELLKESPNTLITVGHIKSPDVRIRLFEQAKLLGASFPVVCASTAYISRHADVSEGTVIMHGAFVNANTSISQNTIVNSAALVEHDCEIGAHCHISTGVRINGGVRIGAGCFIGSGVIIREGLNIAASSIIAAGSVLLSDCDTPGTYIGSPASLRS